MLQLRRLPLSLLSSLSLSSSSLRCIDVVIRNSTSSNRSNSNIINRSNRFDNDGFDHAPSRPSTWDF